MKKILCSLIFLASFNVYSQESMTINLDSSAVVFHKECKTKTEDGPVYFFNIIVPLSDELFNEAFSKDYLVFVIHEQEENRDFFFEGFDVGDSEEHPSFSIYFRHFDKELDLSIDTKEMSPAEQEAVLKFIRSID